jgi:hypothetical protein
MKLHISSGWICAYALWVGADARAQPQAGGWNVRIAAFTTAALHEEHAVMLTAGGLVALPVACVTQVVRRTSKWHDPSGRAPGGHAVRTLFITIIKAVQFFEELVAEGAF